MCGVIPIPRRVEENERDFREMCHARGVRYAGGDGVEAIAVSGDGVRGPGLAREAAVGDEDGVAGVGGDAAVLGTEGDCGDGGDFGGDAVLAYSGGVGVGG